MTPLQRTRQAAEQMIEPEPFVNKEAEFWKQIAIYLADQHAANLCIAVKSRCVKSDKQRLKLIMQGALNFITLEKSTSVDWSHPNYVQHVIDRLKRNIAAIEKLQKQGK